MSDLELRAYFYQLIGQTLFSYILFILIGYKLLGKSFKENKNADKIVFGIFTALGLFLAIGDGFTGIIRMIELWLCIGFKAIFFPSGKK